ncbi:hypothetical protein HKBW3S42_02183, partial [Candidatus Hakubella thermalkaliphila]
MGSLVNVLEDEVISVILAKLEPKDKRLRLDYGSQKDNT